jgi:DNA-binding SARP family transcriptional activator/tetratricopeptide (TPR) repeat protein
MQVRLLGPVDVTVDGHARAINGLRRKALVAALALHAGDVVSVDRLTDLIWDSRPPPGAGRTLQSHVSQVRRLLGDGAVIRPVPPGYVLDLPGDGTDVGVAQHLIREGTTATDPGDGARALREAVGLWRGPPLAELAGWRWFGEQARWLESLLAQATRALTEHRLALGEHAALVADLQSTAREQPLDEDLHRQLMLALYRSGRQAESLTVYRELRALLVAELGIEPGADLRDLEQAILRQEPVLSWTPPRDSAIAAAQPPRPRQLPMAVATFAGRQREIATLDRLLEQMDHLPLIAAVSGTAGVGKTTLAVHWAHAVAERCPDGQLYANLRGFGPRAVPVEPDEALRGFLEALGVSGERVPAALDERAALYRSLLTSRRMLVLLDNAKDADQVRPLLPGTGPTVVLITSRNRLHGLAVTEAAQLLPLDTMTTSDAAELLALRLGRRRVGAEPEAVGDLIGRCARLPLALAIAAARAASEPDQPLATLAAELRTTENVLGVLGLGDEATDVRTVFSWSYRTLSPAAARLFRLLAVHPGPDLTVPAAASLVATTRAEAHESLVELVRASLVNEHTPGRYQSHDLLRSYAAELARLTDSDDDRRAALVRTLDHYMYSAHAAVPLLGPLLIDLPDLPVSSGIDPDEPPDHDRAWAWFRAEEDVLLAATRLSAAAGFDRHTWHLTSTLESFLDRRGRWQEQADICELAVAATRRLGDRTGLAAALRMSSRIHVRLGQWDLAFSLAHEGLQLYEQLDDQTGAAFTHLQLGLVHDQRAEHRDAARHSLTAHNLFQQAGNANGQALALNCLGWAHACLGEYAEALGFCERALPPLQEAGDRDSEAGTWDSIGFAQHHLGLHDKARESYWHALALARQVGNALLEAEILAHLANTEQTTGRQDAARHAWQQALTIFEQLNHPKAGLVRARMTEHVLSAGLPDGAG